MCSGVFKFLKLNAITGKYLCQVEPCGSEIYPHAKNCERKSVNKRLFSGLKFITQI